jgi:YgiT-type zinc finger domain-containing protein
MVTKCYFCRGKVQQQHITLDWRWGERLFVIRNVPVGVCDQCGEKYLDTRVYKDMERITASNDYRLGRMTVDILGFPIQAAA